MELVDLEKYKCDSVIQSSLQFLRLKSWSEDFSGFNLYSFGLDLKLCSLGPAIGLGLSLEFHRLS